MAVLASSGGRTKEGEATQVVEERGGVTPARQDRTLAPSSRHFWTASLPGLSRSSVDSACLRDCGLDLDGVFQIVEGRSFE